MWQASQSQRSSSSSDDAPRNALQRHFSAGHRPRILPRSAGRGRPGADRRRGESRSARAHGGAARHGHLPNRRRGPDGRRRSPPRARPGRSSRARVASSGSSRRAASNSTAERRAAVDGEGDLGAQQLARARSSSSSGPDSRRRQEPQRRSGAPASMLAWAAASARWARRAARASAPPRARGRRPPRPARRAPARGRPSARARRRRPRRARRRLRPVPGAAVGIDVWVGRVGQRAVDAPPLLAGGCAVDRRPDQRMPEAHAGADLDQARPPRPAPRRRRRCPSRSAARHTSSGIPDRLRRRDQQEPPRGSAAGPPAAAGSSPRSGPAAAGASGARSRPPARPA